MQRVLGLISDLTVDDVVDKLFLNGLWREASKSRYFGQLFLKNRHFLFCCLETSVPMANRKLTI
uniref:Uncharacterized protein n=1 Tax=Romanomermis culicivorax TaxID=13658 RepID=A0A915K105_ROMCU